MKAENEVLAHNEIRFDICLAGIWPMVEDGTVDMPDLIAKIKDAIIETCNRELEWQPYPGDGHVVSTGGDGREDKPLHNEVIVYDLS